MSKMSNSCTGICAYFGVSNMCMQTLVPSITTVHTKQFSSARTIKMHEASVPLQHSVIHFKTLTFNFFPKHSPQPFGVKFNSDIRFLLRSSKTLCNVCRWVMCNKNEIFANVGVLPVGFSSPPNSVKRDLCRGVPLLRSKWRDLVLCQGLKARLFEFLVHGIPVEVQLIVQND